MKFDEQGFRHLVDETIATIIRLGTTSHAVLDRYKRFTEMLVGHLKSLDQPFELTLCLKWVNSLDHDPACVLSASYVGWKALHRFVHLPAEQQAGTLTEWRHYLCFTPELPETDEYKNILVEFQEVMKEEGKYPTTIKSYSSMARKLLLYLESVGITKEPKPSGLFPDRPVQEPEPERVPDGIVCPEKVSAVCDRCRLHSLQDPSLCPA